jgi:hypothetical protein
VLEHLPGMHEALGSSPSTENNKTTTKTRLCLLFQIYKCY